MGFNTVVVIYNDRTGDKNRSLERLDEAVLSYHYRDRVPGCTSFGFGQVISRDHADGEQVVIVSRNSGVRADEATNLGWQAIDDMKACLARHGYKVVKLNKPRKPSPSTDKAVDHD